MLTIKKKNLFWEYFLMLSIISLTGFEFFYADRFLLFLLVGPLSFFLFVKRKHKFSKKTIYFLLILVIVSFLQAVIFKIPYFVPINILIRFLIYYFVASIIIKNFSKVYVNILFIFSVISLILYVLINISPFIYNFLLSISNGIVRLGYNSETEIFRTNPNNTLIFFTIPHELKFRNSGPFWEPGLFGVFLSIAFALSIFKNGFKNKKTIVFLLAGLTTLSTTTFVAFFLIIGANLYLKKANVYTIFRFVFLSLAVILVFNLPFINEKIKSDIDNRDKAYSRVGAMILHYNQILDSPWIGYGAAGGDDQEQRLGEIMVTPNGLTNIIRNFGIPFSILYFYLLFNSARIIASQILTKKRIQYSIFLFLVLLLVVFSQDVTTRHFYYILIMLPLVINALKDNNEYFLWNGKKYIIKTTNY